MNGQQLQQACEAMGMPAGISETFNRMEVAEEEIAAAMVEYPLKADAVNGAFGALQGTTVLSQVSLEFYRAHAREILGRVARGGDLAEPTSAELCAFISGLSARAPLQSDLVVVYEQAFERAMPDKAASMPGQARESWDGAARLVEEDVRGQLRNMFQKTEGSHPRFTEKYQE